MPPRLHLYLLTLILLIGFVRGAYWVVTTEVWSRVDEAQHYGYVESLARGHGMPEVGKDKLQLDTLAVAKHSPTLGFRSYGVVTVNQDADWGPFGQLYEGGGYQGPAYYAALVPVYWITQPFSTITTIFALRFATLLIVLTSIPLLYFLARELFPRRPAVWLASPALLVAMQGFNGNTVSINNDSALVPLSIAALIPVASAWRGMNNRQAIIAGALFGLAMLSKSTASPVAGMALIVLAALLLIRRAHLRDVLVWGLAYSAAAFAIYAPYLIWNFATYGAPSASSQVNELLSPVLPRTPYNLDGLKYHFHNVRVGFSDFLPYSLGTKTDYVRTFEIAPVVAVILGLAISLRRRALDEAAALTWAAVAFPVAFVIVLASSISIYSQATVIVGRHLYAILGLYTIAVAAGVCTAFGARLGVLAVILLIGVAFIYERQLTDHYISTTYESGILFNRLAPVVDQPLNESYTLTDSVSASASCPVEAVGLSFGNPQPPTLTITSPAAAEATFLSIDLNVSIYTLASPLSGDFTILTPGMQVGRQFADRDPTISLAGATGDPVVRLYCAPGDPEAFRFKQMFYPGHPNLGYSLVRAWADVWYWIGWALVAISAAGMALVAYGELRWRYSPSGSHM